MPTFIVKANPDRDLYGEWSTVVDNVVSIGTAADYPADRVARADANGTSALGRVAGWFSWDDDEFLVAVQGDRCGMFTLKRTDLEAYLDAYLRDDEEAAMALLTPRPTDDDEATP